MKFGSVGGDVNNVFRTLVIAETQVFVIGKQVDDFRVVNYEDLFSNGLAAIQELSKQNDALKQENDALKSDVAAIKKALGL